MNEENGADMIGHAVAKGTIGAFTVLAGMLLVFWGLGVMHLEGGSFLGPVAVVSGAAVGVFGFSRIWIMLPKP